MPGPAPAAVTAHAITSEDEGQEVPIYGGFHGSLKRTFKRMEHNQGVIDVVWTATFDRLILTEEGIASGKTETVKEILSTAFTIQDLLEGKIWDFHGSSFTLAFTWGYGQQSLHVNPNFAMWNSHIPTWVGVEIYRDLVRFKEWTTPEVLDIDAMDES